MKINPKDLILEQYWDFFYKRYPYKVAYSGRNSGKSVNIIRALLLLMLKYKRMTIVCAREIMASISDSSYAEIKKQIYEMKIESFFKITKSTIECPASGSIMVFKGLYRNIESIKGIPDINIVWFEEAQTISMDSLTMTIDTLREEGAEAWFSFNPKNPTDAVSQMFIEGDTPNSLIVSTNYDKNKYVSESKLKEILYLKETDLNQYNHRYLGQYLDISENNFFTLALIQKSINQLVDHPSGAIKAGLDIAEAGGDRTILTIVQDQKVLHTKEWKSCPDHVLLANQVIAELTNYNVTSIAVDAVGVGFGIHSILQNRIGRTIDVHKFKGSYVRSEAYANLRSEAIGLTLDWMNKGACIPNNKGLIEDLQVTRYFYNSKDKLCIVSKDKLKKEGHRSTDYLDSLSMAIWCPEKQKDMYAGLMDLASKY